MRMVFGLVLVAGLALAGFAVYMAQNYIGSYQSALEQERANRVEAVPTTPVMVATRAMKYGEPITLEDIRMVDWPKAALPEGTFADAESVVHENPDLARLVLRPMEKDEAILEVKVTAPGEDAGITSQLERGMRAFAIKVDVSSGVSGFLRPGDRVDVYWTGRAPKADNNLPSSDVTKLIEVGVALIAVDQTSTNDAAEAIIARTVTVAATPQQVASLAQAQSTGNLSLSLVGSNDDTVAEAIDVDQRSLLGITAEAETVEVQKEEICTIRTRRGAEVVELPIPCTN